MTYMFRVRLRLSDGTRIDSPDIEMVLRDDDGIRVYFRSLVEGQAIRDAGEMAMRGQGYATEHEARTDGERWTVALGLGMAGQFMPTEFGERAGGGGYSQAFLDQFHAENPGSVLHWDAPGLIVVAEEPIPRFGRIQVTAVAHKNGVAVLGDVLAAYDADLAPDPRSRLAVDTYSASHFMPSEDSRFLMLMIAVEALIEPGKRPAAQVAAIGKLIEHVGSLGLDTADAETLRQIVQGLALESINTAGKRLVGALGDRRYLDKTPTRFFSDCYKMRSSMVHGNVARPDADAVRAHVGALEWFVRDLLMARHGLTPAT